MGVVIGNNGKTDEIIIGGSKSDGVELGSKTPVLRGPRGYSNYELAIQNGFEGTEEEYLESLKGEPGTNDYNEQINKPKINGVELIGNKTSKDLKLEDKYVNGIKLENKILILSFNDGSNLSVDLSSLSNENITTELTEEQIKAINEMIVILREELTLEYDDKVLDVDFLIEDNNLIVTNNILGLDFNINENKELEVSY